MGALEDLPQYVRGEHQRVTNPLLLETVAMGSGAGTRRCLYCENPMIVVS